MSCEEGHAVAVQHAKHVPSVLTLTECWVLDRLKQVTIVLELLVCMFHHSLIAV